MLPYITVDRSHPPKRWARTACRGAACVLETNIRTLPDHISHAASSASDIYYLEAENTRILGDDGKKNYLEYPPSNAVDMKAGTAFRSLSRTSLHPAYLCPVSPTVLLSVVDAALDDTVVLDILTDISDAREWTAVELAWLVDSPTESILKSCTYEWSSDNVTWVSCCQAMFRCRQEADLSLPERRPTHSYLLRYGAGSHD